MPPDAGDESRLDDFEGVEEAEKFFFEGAGDCGRVMRRSVIRCFGDVDGVALQIWIDRIVAAQRARHRLPPMKIGERQKLELALRLMSADGLMRVMQQHIPIDTADGVSMSNRDWFRYQRLKRRNRLS